METFGSELTKKGLFQLLMESRAKMGGIEFQNFTTNDGLGSNTAWCSYMNKNGILWFGTKGGVTKFDGRAFKIIPIPLASGKSKCTKYLSRQNGAILVRDRR